MLDFVKKSLFVGVAGSALLFATAAKADIVPSLDSIDPLNGEFQWNYNASVDALHRVEPGDFFTIYDFAGFVEGSNDQPAGWEFSSDIEGITPGGVTPVDGAFPNLTWTWMGDQTLGAAEEGDFDLGTFSAVSVYGQTTLGNFTSRSTKDIQEGPGVIEDGTKTDAVGSVAVPIPLPGAVYMFPLGAAVAGFWYRRLRRRV